jgi:hypothetical protein
MPAMLVELTPDIDLGKASSCVVTLTLADTVYTVAIPTWAKGVRLRPSADVRFALGEDPPAVEPAKAGNAALTDFGIGNYAIASEWTKYLLPARAGDNYTLRLLCDGAGATCKVCFWGG